MVETSILPDCTLYPDTYIRILKIKYNKMGLKEEKKQKYLLAKKSEIAYKFIFYLPYLHWMNHFLVQAKTVTTKFFRHFFST